MVSQQLATELGIPFTLPVTDAFRLPRCDASVMQLAEVEGDNAIYRGVCASQHQYQQKISVKSLQNNNIVETEDFHLNEEGKLEIGQG